MQSFFHLSDKSVALIKQLTPLDGRILALINPNSSSAGHLRRYTEVRSESPCHSSAASTGSYRRPSTSSSSHQTSRSRSIYPVTTSHSSDCGDSRSCARSSPHRSCSRLGRCLGHRPPAPASNPTWATVHLGDGCFLERGGLPSYDPGGAAKREALKRG